MTAVARIATQRVPDVVLVPSEAIFQRDGAPIVYKLDGSMFVETPVTIRKRGKEQAIVDRGVAARRSNRDATPAARDDSEERMSRRIVLPLVGDRRSSPRPLPRRWPCPGCRPAATRFQPPA